MNLLVHIKKQLQGFNLEVSFQENEGILGFLGASGSGKSMTLRCIAGIDTPDSGRIILNDRVLFDSEKKINVPIRKRKVGFLFQNYALFPHLTVENNIGFGLHKKVSKEEIRKIINNKISMLRLSGLENRFPFELSGGQQQRVALARALVTEPDILLLDEPFSALDEYLRAQMVEELSEDLSNYNGKIIFVTHNMEEAYQLCHRICVFSKGRIEEQGTREDIFKNPSTITTANLTGCKNISKARLIESNTVEAVDWGCKIQLPADADAQIKYIGLREHYITLDDNYNRVNSFFCWPVSISSTLFRTRVYLKLNKEPLNKQDYHLIWDISNEQWEKIKDNPRPWKIRICTENLIFIRE